MVMTSFCRSGSNAETATIRSHYVNIAEGLVKAGASIPQHKLQSYFRLPRVCSNCLCGNSRFFAIRIWHCGLIAKNVTDFNQLKGWGGEERIDLIKNKLKINLYVKSQHYKTKIWSFKTIENR